MPKEIRHKLPDPIPENVGENKIRALDNFQLKLLLALDDDDRFSPYVDTKWTALSHHVTRGFIDILAVDGTTVTMTATKQNRAVELMLRTIASVVPVIAEEDIVQDTEGIEDIAQYEKYILCAPN